MMTLFDGREGHNWAKDANSVDANTFVECDVDVSEIVEWIAKKVNKQTYGLDQASDIEQLEVRRRRD